MNILTENFCPECDEVVHQVFDREDFYRHEVGALYCPKCGHLILPCNECDDHSNCMDCPWSKCAERSTAMSDEAYMRYLKAHEPKIYKKFKDGEMGDHYAKVIKKIEGV